MAAADRAKILSLYRQILKFTRNWKTGDKSETAIAERKSLYEEARQKFGANKGLSDSKEIGRLIEEAEIRLAQAQHYGYPFERPKYLEPNTAFYSFNSMPMIFVQFARLFYAGAKVSDEMIAEVIQAAVENDEDAVRLSNIFASNIIQKYFIKKRYSRAICKRFVDYYEQKKEEAPAAIYSLLTASIVEDTDFSYRLFLSRNGESAIVIREKNQTLSEGTTGLSLWQAACDLSCFLSFNFIAPPAKVLELGAGCGLSGIAAASLFPEAEVVLTDCDANVLNQLELNLKCNKLSDRIKTHNLDWTKFEKSKVTEGTNLILAADVVYDRSLLPSLCKVICSLITSTDVVCLVSCTKRDPQTLEAFEKQLTASDLRIREKCICQNGTFAVGGNSFTCDLFPHSSTLDTPTIIYNIIKA